MTVPANWTRRILRSPALSPYRQMLVRLDADEERSGRMSARNDGPGMLWSDDVDGREEERCHCTTKVSSSE